MFPNHDVITSPGIKLSDSIFGRLCGGIAMLIRKPYAKYVKQISLEQDNILAFKLDHSLLSTEQDCILIAAYVPPENSAFYKESEVKNGISCIEDVLLDLNRKYGDLDYILCGDFNARTGGQNSTCSGDDLLNIHMHNNDNDNDYLSSHGGTNNVFFNERKSKDKGVNNFGTYLINVCENFGLSVVNGLCKRNFNDDFTYICQSGASVIDLFLVSDNLLEHCINFGIHHMIETKHSAVSLDIRSLSQNINKNDSKNNSEFSFQKYIWDPNKYEHFNEIISSENSKNIIDSAISLIDTDINLALSKFNECLIDAGQSMKKTIHVSNKPRNIWFDLECAQSRQVVRQHLRKYVRTSLDNDRVAYAAKRKEYKELLRNKKLIHKNNFLSSLRENLNDSSKFWSSIHSVLYRKQVQNSISLEEWFNHFSSVFNSPHDSVDDTYQTINDEVPNHNQDFENEITEIEIKAAIQALKNNKASGPDSLINEFYKASCDIIMPFLIRYFNHIFENGLFPSDWSSSILQPIHKKGDVNNPDNYRGISLLNVCSKIYSFIINQRINDWIESCNILGEEQAGFRRNRSTLDHVFTLYAMIQKQLVKHKKLYVAFIDFRKAFDGISREKLWSVLRNIGIRGKMFRALKSMYEFVSTKVRVNGVYTDNFLCPRGLKQGETCSPVIFSLFINELTKDILENGKHGVQLNPDFVQILILLFADDVALISDTVVGLQTQLDVLYDSAKKLDLVVNRDKSNIVVFRNGGHLSKNEKWSFGEDLLQVVNSYKYLGVILSTRLSFTSTFEDLAAKAKKGVVAILRTLWSIGDHTPQIFFKLFDSQIQPILTYGAEIWGLSENQETIERIHLFAIKRFLGVHTKTPRHLVYGDTGRFPLFIVTYTKCIKFWLKILRMDQIRLCNKAYRMLIHLQNQNYVTWIDKIKTILYRYGFGCVWEAQGVGNEALFMRQFRERLIDCYRQTWHSSIESHDFYRTYTLFKSEFFHESYITDVTNFWHRKALARFRFGMAEMKDSYLKFDSSIVRKDRNCPFCPNHIENEIHFLLVCPKYNSLRDNFLIRDNWRPVSVQFLDIMSKQSMELNVSIAHFIYKALQLRQKFLT